MITQLFILTRDSRFFNDFGGSFFLFYTSSTILLNFFFFIWSAWKNYYKGRTWQDSSKGEHWTTWGMEVKYEIYNTNSEKVGKMDYLGNGQLVHGFFKEVLCCWILYGLPWVLGVEKWDTDIA